MPFEDVISRSSFSKLKVNSIYSDSEINNGNSGFADTIDWSQGNKQKSTLTANCVYTFIAPNGVANVQLKIIQGVGSNTITWPGSVIWIGDSAPTLSTVINSVDFIMFFWDGTNYWGGMIGPGDVSVGGGEVVVGALTYNQTVSCDVSLGTVFMMTATGDSTINATGAGTAGTELTFVLTGDATGGRAITFGTNFVANDTLILSASAQSIIKFISNGTAWIESSRSPEVHVYMWR
jgi:hypothetical protein